MANKTEKEHYYAATQENKMLKAYIFSVVVPELPLQPDLPVPDKIPVK